MFSVHRFVPASVAALALAWLAPAAAFAASEASTGSEPTTPSARMVYVDAELAPQTVSGSGFSNGRVERRGAAANPLAEQLEQGLDDYRARWGGLPEIEIPAGPALRAGASGPRVQALRARLGLVEDGNFDAELTEALLAYKRAHGLGEAAVADATAIRSLNRGAAYHERIIEANLQRARALPTDMGQRFILVDDNEADNVYHEIIIRRAGFTGEVLVFESGAQALDFLRSDPLSLPTCLFLDINMPQMNGFEFARLATPLLQDKPLVRVAVLTSSDAPQDRRRASDVPLIQDFITKPLTREHVRKLLEAT